MQLVLRAWSLGQVSSTESSDTPPTDIMHVPVGELPSLLRRNC